MIITKKGMNMDKFNPEIKQGQILVNTDIRDIFKCSTQGGMNSSVTTNSLVLVSKHYDNLYHDRWIDHIFHYTGEGQQGDQQLTRNNKKLAESKTNGISVFLFEKFKSNQYRFVGEVELAANPYQETQRDSNDTKRRVWVFPLKIKSGFQQLPLPKEIIEQSQEEELKRARALSDDNLRKKAMELGGKSGTRNAVSKYYERNAFVGEYAKRRAKGICQLCNKEAPFKTKSGDPFLETHHIEWLSKGGLDAVENTVALCPNCHKKMHILDLESDIFLLHQKVKEEV